LWCGLDCFDRGPPDSAIGGVGHWPMRISLPGSVA
jgi:hypothetical protein